MSGSGGRSEIGDMAHDNPMPPTGTYPPRRVPDISNIITQVKKLHSLE